MHQILRVIRYLFENIKIRRDKADGRQSERIKTGLSAEGEEKAIYSQPC